MTTITHLPSSFSFPGFRQAADLFGRMFRKNKTAPAKLSVGCFGFMCENQKLEDVPLPRLLQDIETLARFYLQRAVLHDPSVQQAPLAANALLGSYVGEVMERMENGGAKDAPQLRESDTLIRARKLAERVHAIKYDDSLDTVCRAILDTGRRSQPVPGPYFNPIPRLENRGGYHGKARQERDRRVKALSAPGL